MRPSARRWGSNPLLRPYCNPMARRALAEQLVRVRRSSQSKSLRTQGRYWQSVATMNMMILKRSWHRPRRGDLFVYRIKSRPYGFGRVIRTDTHIGGFPSVILIYIYEVFSKDPVLGNVKLEPPRLLIPPEGINRTPWTCGYFLHVENIPLTKHQVLPRHCFRTSFEDGDVYHDEYGRRLKRRSEPCGYYSLNSYKTIDAALSAALGVKLSPDTVPDPSAGWKNMR